MRSKTASERIKLKTQYDAKYMLYLLDIFDGKLSINDIQNIDLKLLIEMKNIKEEKLEKEAKKMAMIQNEQNKSKQSGVYEGIPPHIQALYGDL